MDITKFNIGTPVIIKTDDDIYDSYISAITLSDENFVYFKSGSIRINLLDKLKATSQGIGNKLDVSGGLIKGSLSVTEQIYMQNKKVATKEPLIETYRGNLNDIKENKTVYAMEAATNLPEAGYSFYIETVASNSSYILQKATIVASVNTAFRSYERQCYNGNWSEWKKVSHPNITTGTEFETGRIIDGKKEYGKIFRQLLSNSPGTTTISTGLSNVTYRYLHCTVSVGNYAYQTENIKTNDYSIVASISNNVVSITTYLSNFSTYYANVEIHYTKN